MPSVLATAGITNCDVPISNSNGTGAKTQPWPNRYSLCFRLFLNPFSTIKPTAMITAAKARIIKILTAKVMKPIKAMSCLSSIIIKVIITRRLPPHPAARKKIDISKLLIKRT